MDQKHYLQLIKAHKLFKVVCGAGNEDPEEVRKLAKIYTLAGAGILDMSARKEVVQKACQGIVEAQSAAAALNLEFHRPLVMVSVGLQGDPHIRKALIDSDKCTQCGLCTEVCEQDTINEEEDYSIVEYRCIGCGKCADVCSFNAVSFYEKRVNIGEVLPELMALGADTFELHAATYNVDELETSWEAIARLVTEHPVSMCLDRSHLSDTSLLERVRYAYSVAGDRTMIQADGVPMSGGKDDFNTTLQAIATSDIVRKSGLPVMILASGGTNSKTGELARICGVPIHGVSLGTYGRKILKQQITDSGFDKDPAVLKQAIAIARELIVSNFGE